MDCVIESKENIARSGVSHQFQVGENLTKNYMSSANSQQRTSRMKDTGLV